MEFLWVQFLESYYNIQLYLMIYLFPNFIHTLLKGLNALS